MFSEEIQTVVVAMLVFLLELVFVYANRCSSLPYKRAFLEVYCDKRIPFWKDLTTTLKSKENTVHTIAFLTLDLMFCVPLGISVGTQLLPLVIGSGILIVTNGAVFAIANTLMWCFVHKRWFRPY